MTKKIEEDDIVASEYQDAFKTDESGIMYRAGVKNTEKPEWKQFKVPRVRVLHTKKLVRSKTNI